MNKAVENFRQAHRAHEEALEALKPLVAAHIDAHPELDVTGEWERMKGHFGASHVKSWDFVADDAVAVFEKTTLRGMNTHTIMVALDDIEE